MGSLLVSLEVIVDRFVLGQRVLISSFLKREYKSGGVRIWSRVNLPEPIEGVWTGWRTLCDGTTDYNYGEGNSWIPFPDGFFRAECVVFNARMNFRFAPSDAIVLVED